MGGKSVNRDLMAHCRREALHAQWEILLDDEFVEAYRHGIVIKCCDGITRRFYPRIFTYSADYPEKYVLHSGLGTCAEFLLRVILACIRTCGTCLCPRCCIPKCRVHNLGMKLDMVHRTSLARVDDDAMRRKVKTAREIIYEKNYAINSEAVENLLKAESMVPTIVSLGKNLNLPTDDPVTKNAFSTRLAAFGFNLFSMLVVDLMHEFELGVWKALFIHLIRILNAKSPALVNEMDYRYVTPLYALG